MSLPSRYAPGGLSPQEAKGTITTGRYKKRPIEYTIKTIEDKVELAVNHSTNEEDIEMVPMDDFNEVNVISDYVTQSRNTSDDNYVNYDTMMVDGGNEDMIIEPNTSYLVLDTNFILSHLKLLHSIKQTAFKYHIRIIVPLAVMQELDGLKKSTKPIQESDQLEHLHTLSYKTIGHLARWANDWIYGELADVNSVVKGQKMKQRLDRTAAKDDSILDCCLYFKQNYTRNLVVLLSNDKNLCLKALANEILTVSFKPGMTSELISQTIYEESLRSYGGNPNENRTLSTDENEYIKQQPSSTASFDEIANTIYNEIFVLTKSAIHHVMVHTYEDDLDLIQSYQPDEIYDLDDCSRVINQFWVSSFSEYLRHINFKDGFITRVPSDVGTLRSFVDEWTRLLKIIYDELLDENQIEALSKLIHRWNSMAFQAEPDNMKYQ